MPSSFVWGWLDPGADLAAEAIAALFPAWTLSGTSGLGPASTVLGTLIGRLSAVACQVLLVYVVYSAFAKSLSAAEAGTVRDDRHNWVTPIRVALAAVMLLPLPSGYCGAQMFLSAAGRAAIGLGANLAREGQTAIGPQAQAIFQPMIPGTKRTVAALIQNELCRALVNAAANNERLVPAPRAASGDGFVTWSYDLAAGHATGAPVCGSATVRVGSGATASAGAVDLTGIQRDAVQGVLEGSIRPAVAAVAREFWERRTASSLTALQGVLVSASAAYTARLTDAATAATAQLRARYTAEEMRRGDAGADAGVAQMQDFGWSGLGAYYASLTRLNGHTFALVASVPVVTGPSYQGLGRYLSSDLAPLIQAARSYGDRLQAYVSVNDGIDTPAGGADIFNGATPDAQGAGTLEQVLRKIDFSENVVRFFVKNLAPVASNFADPFSALMRLGNDMATLALIALGAAAVFSSAPASAGLAAWNVLTLNWGGVLGTLTGHTLMSFLGTPIFYALLALLIPGLLLGFVVPMTPALMWTMGVLGWFVRVVEAMVAVPLWMLAHASFAGQGLHGRGMRGWANVLAIFLTPALMVVGFFASYWVFAWVSRLIFSTFYVAAQSTLVRGWLVANLAGVVVLLAMFVLLHVVVAIQSFRLITVVSVNVPQWIGLDSPDRVDAHSLAQDAGMIGMGATLAQIRGGAEAMKVVPDGRGGARSGADAIDAPAKHLGMDRAVAAGTDVGPDRERV